MLLFFVFLVIAYFFQEYQQTRRLIADFVGSGTPSPMNYLFLAGHVKRVCKKYVTPYMHINIYLYHSCCGTSHGLKVLAIPLYYPPPIACENSVPRIVFNFYVYESFFVNGYSMTISKED